MDIGTIIKVIPQLMLMLFRLTKFHFCPLNVGGKNAIAGRTVEKQGPILGKIDDFRLRSALMKDFRK